MNIDRNLQRAVLERLADAYPEPLTADGMKDLADKRSLTAAAAYLHEHGLISAKFSETLSEPRQVYLAQIKARGIDFLADDGGLSAVLGVITIKFHDDTIRQIVEAKLLQADLPEMEKSSLIQALRQAPAESIKHLTTRLLDAGLENLPRAIQLMQTWIQHAQT